MMCALVLVCSPNFNCLSLPIWKILLGPEN